MSGETELRPSSWTTDTLKEYYDQRFIDQDRAVQAALQAAKEAVLKAESASEKRFESVNEFRAQLSDQTNTLVPRKEYSVQHESIEKRITDLTDRFNKVEGKNSGVIAAWGYLVVTIGLAATIITVILAFND